MRFLKILVSVNGKDADDKEAIELACMMAKEVKGTIDVVYVIRVKRSLPLDAEIESEVQKAEEVLSWAEEIADEQDYEVETNLIQTREVGPAIVDEAMEHSADLIIMGMGYRKRFGQFDPGDVVSYVLKNAPCRVLLLRQPLQ